MIEHNVKQLLSRLAAGNAFGERVTLVAATKTRTPEEINRAIRAGIADVGENRAQEFRDKSGLLLPCRRHFIGRLQTNKVKYLVGNVSLIQSVDNDPLAEEIARASLRAGTETEILIEINAGGEAAKGGYPPAEGMRALGRLSKLEGLRVKGFMTVLPIAREEELRPLCDGMRALFERARAESADVGFLSMGMSGDWEFCLSRGANMIRLGTAIFGAREIKSPQNG